MVNDRHAGLSAAARALDLSACPVRRGLIATGIHRSELLALRWSDFDEEIGMLTVAHDRCMTSPRIDTQVADVLDRTVRINDENR
jgi:integrase